MRERGGREREAVERGGREREAVERERVEKERNLGLED